MIIITKKQIAFRSFIRCKNVKERDNISTFSKGSVWNNAFFFKWWCKKILYFRTQMNRRMELLRICSLFSLSKAEQNTEFYKTS